MGVRRRGFMGRDVAVTVGCLVVAAGMVGSLTGATRDLSAAQVCANNLRQLFVGMTAYVNQYNCYPPHAPWPTCMAPETINGVNTLGWDPNIGFILTHGLGLVPPATDSATGHFKWYGTTYADLPDVCKCPAMRPGLLDPTDPEVADPATGEGAPLETLLYQYALSYQTSGTCRSACPVIRERTASASGWGGRNPPIPDPTYGFNSSAGQPYDNMERGVCGVYCFSDPEGDGEPYCWIQAVSPSEVQSPGRTYYLADNCDYRPQPKGTVYDRPPAGNYNGWHTGWGNKVFTGTRHYGYGNVLYLDGRVTRDGQMHIPNWNLQFDPGTNQYHGNQWRVGTFSTTMSLANLQTQWAIMPVLNVKGWESSFDANGVKAE